MVPHVATTPPKHGMNPKPSVSWNRLTAGCQLVPANSAPVESHVAVLISAGMLCAGKKARKKTCLSAHFPQ